MRVGPPRRPPSRSSRRTAPSARAASTRIGSVGDHAVPASTLHGVRLERLEPMKGIIAPIASSAGTRRRRTDHLGEIHVVAIEVPPMSLLTHHVARLGRAHDVIERVLQTDVVAAVVSDPGHRGVLGPREEATLEEVALVVGPHHRQELVGRRARAAVGVEVSVVGLGVLLQRLFSVVGANRNLVDVALAEVELKPAMPRSSTRSCMVPVRARDRRSRSRSLWPFHQP
jgi:hypothetical protein